MVELWMMCGCCGCGCAEVLDCRCRASLCLHGLPFLLFFSSICRMQLDPARRCHRRKSVPPWHVWFELKRHRRMVARERERRRERESLVDLAVSCGWRVVGVRGSDGSGCHKRA